MIRAGIRRCPNGEPWRLSHRDGQGSARRTRPGRPVERVLRRALRGQPGGEARLPRRRGTTPSRGSEPAARGRVGLVDRHSDATVRGGSAGVGQGRGHGGPGRRGDGRGGRGLVRGGVLHRILHSGAGHPGGRRSRDVGRCATAAGRAYGLLCRDPWSRRGRRLRGGPGPPGSAAVPGADLAARAAPDPRGGPSGGARSVRRRRRRRRRAARCPARPERAAGGGGGGADRSGHRRSHDLGRHRTSASGWGSHRGFPTCSPVTSPR